MGLGTNLGDRAGHLRAALEALRGTIKVEAVSDIYESAAVDFTEQPPFWNLAVRGRTSMAPLDLLAAIKRLERQLGREPTFRSGPRVIDIDVLLYGRDRIDDPGLRVPHPRLADRAFVLRPLLDLDPALVHPESGERLADRLSALAPADPLRHLGSVADVLYPAM